MADATAPFPGAADLRDGAVDIKRHRGADDPATLAAEADLKAARLAAVIRREVDRSPPLTAEQIEQLRGLLPAPATVSRIRLGGVMRGESRSSS